jgi:hypothetical protein
MKADASRLKGSVVITPSYWNRFFILTRPVVDAGAGGGRMPALW